MSNEVQIKAWNNLGIRTLDKLAALLGAQIAKPCLAQDSLLVVSDQVGFV